MNPSNEILLHLEDRLARVLAAGWRQADADVIELVGEADRLVEAGFDGLAERVRRIARSPKEQRVGTVSVALCASRMLRVRLAEDDLPSGNWVHLVDERRSVAPDRLLPIGRLALGDDECWACVRLRGTATDLVLVDRPAGGEGPRPWLVQQFLGQPHWRARYPTGSQGDLQRVDVPEYRWLPLPVGGEDVLGTLREAALVGKLVDEAPLLRTTVKLQTRNLAGDDAPSCAWPDAATTRAFRAAAGNGRVWTIAWVEGSRVTPLAVLGSGYGSRAELVHLVAGNPRSEIVE